MPNLVSSIYNSRGLCVQTDPEQEYVHFVGSATSSVACCICPKLQKDQIGYKYRNCVLYSTDNEVYSI